MSSWQMHIRQLNYQKHKVCVLNLIAASFGDREIKDVRDNGERNTGIKNCVQQPEKKITWPCGECDSELLLISYIAPLNENKKPSFLSYDCDILFMICNIYDRLINHEHFPVTDSG